HHLVYHTANLRGHFCADLFLASSICVKKRSCRIKTKTKPLPKQLFAAASLVRASLFSSAEHSCPLLLNNNLRLLAYIAVVL
ncbi:hypothetical protein SB775_31840, partial [Peribacillus sp. SIMBA_075]|uniref:hypothetical protein n=1 Tax=Peribacillus sp. SIMBA_075 TaxID=3085813 RepID=UPI00397AC815